MTTIAARIWAVAALLATLAVGAGGRVAADPSGTGNPSDINTLAAALSKGYGLDNCTAQGIATGQLAALNCGQSPDPSGPVQAKYILFADGDTMARFFTKSISEDVLSSCGANGQSPTTWHQGSDTSAGQLACGTYRNGAEIIWTTQAKNVLGYLRSATTDVAALYQWWQTNG